MHFIESVWIRFDCDLFFITFNEVSCSKNKENDCGFHYAACVFMANIFWYLNKTLSENYVTTNNNRDSSQNKRNHRAIAQLLDSN